MEIIAQISRGGLRNARLRLVCEKNPRSVVPLLSKCPNSSIKAEELWDLSRGTVWQGQPSPTKDSTKPEQQRVSEGTKDLPSPTLSAQAAQDALGPN